MYWLISDVDFACGRTQSVLGLNVFGAFRVQQVVVGDPLQVEVLVAQVVFATEKRHKML